MTLRRKRYSLDDETHKWLGELAATYGSVNRGLAILRASVPFGAKPLTDKFPDGLLVELRGDKLTRAENVPRGGRGGPRAAETWRTADNHQDYDPVRRGKERGK